MDARGVRIWDLPTRLFHWALATLVVLAFITAKGNGAWFDWHPRVGMAILALVLFRLLWGFAGSRYARFATFVRAPWTVWREVRAGGAGFSGHGPLGGYAVLAMLLALGVQATLGLFANDAVAYEGPWVKLIGSELSETLSTLHRRGQWVIGGLVALHLVAIIWITQARHEPLVRTMLTGNRLIDAPAARDDTWLRWRAALLFALVAALVGWLVSL